MCHLSLSIQISFTCNFSQFPLHAIFPFDSCLAFIAQFWFIHPFISLLDCTPLYCQDPLTNSPPGTTCLCVLPIKVELRLGIPLYTFFGLVSELAQNIASGVFMKQSQVRVMGANAATEDPEKTAVLIDLVPLGARFDNTTTLSVFERFWHKQVIINPMHFGSYDVLYVLYPGESLS
jgi:hypothetical protein